MIPQPPPQPTPGVPVDVDTILKNIYIEGQEILTERLRQHAKRFLLTERDELEGYSAIVVPGEPGVTRRLQFLTRSIALMLGGMEERVRQHTVEMIAAVLVRVWHDRNYHPTSHERIASAVRSHLGHMRKHFPPVVPTSPTTEDRTV
jgi:hypothetical protein